MFNALSCYLCGIYQGSQNNYGCPVLVVVHYGYSYILQLFLYFKASWSSYVFQVNAAENRGYIFCNIDYFIIILVFDAYRKRIYIGKLLKKNAFSFHHL